jgi:cell division transport system permease protein
MTQTETKTALASKPTAAFENAKSLLFKKRDKPVRIMPQSGVAGTALTAVIAVMCYLGSLALGAVIVINKSVNNWTSDISGQVTVQIRPDVGRNINQDIDKILAILRVTRGITGAKIISANESAKLLEPWLGTGAFLKDLPVPRLIAVNLDRKTPPNLASLAKTLQENIPGATLDTHRQWQNQITRSAGTLKFIGYAVLTLLSLTTAAIIVFATRAAMANNSVTVEVLHLVGAHDNYIARLIQWRFLKLGLRAGLIAGVCGALTLYALTTFGSGSGSPELIDASVQLISGPAALGITDYLTFLLVPIVATLIVMITARLAILRILVQVL